MKNVLKGTHFANVEEVTQATAEALMGVKSQRVGKPSGAVGSASRYR